MSDLKNFIGTIPYATELFGVYQPLLGWKSKKVKERIKEDKKRVENLIKSKLGFFHEQRAWSIANAAEQAQSESKDNGGEEAIANFPASNRNSGFNINQLPVEASVALGDIDVNKTISLFLPNLKVLNQLKEDPLADFDPNTHTAILSPIGLIHLYKQYFFELETFLGTPVGHIWLSPGGEVELIESSSRKKITETSYEFNEEYFFSTETERQQSIELSEAIKSDSQSNTNLGITTNAGVNLGVFKASASGSFSMANSRGRANESTHRRTRQQSERVASEIRRSLNTTFRTVTEESDSSSKRYVIKNTTNNLINYELRRKMRRVGVQVQHIGLQMCWQIFIDDPGMELALPELIHIAKKEDIKKEISNPESEVPKKPIKEEVIIRIPFQPDLTSLQGYHENYGDVYLNGVEESAGYVILLLNENGEFEPNPDKRRRVPDEKADVIIYQFESENFTPPEPGYTLKNNVREIAITPGDTRGGGSPRAVVNYQTIGNKVMTTLELVEFDDHRNINLSVELTWEPPPKLSVSVEEQKEITQAEKRQLKEEYLNAVKERVNLAGNVKKRPSGDLRKEERISVYRRLIDVLIPGSDVSQRRTYSELVRSIFDIEKMLYYVAPEWWNPRRQKAEFNTRNPFVPGYQDPDKIGTGVVYPTPNQNAENGTPAYVASVETSDTISWEDGRIRDKYYITETSNPAPMGSSLGWLLQLDADTHRNAFLNSPWVKAVIPIRHGMEEAAINWLKHAHIEGIDGLDAAYGAPEEDARFWQDPGQTEAKSIEEVLRILADDISEDSRNIGGMLATEKVFETGFDPLEGGFRADPREDKIFDQWIEILPTEQVVALEYNASDHLPNRNSGSQNQT